MLIGLLFLFLGGLFLWGARVVNYRGKDSKRNPSAIAYAAMGAAVGGLGIVNVVASTLGW